MTKNVLYYGDNLDILRRYIKDETIEPLKKLIESGKIGGRNELYELTTFF